MSNNSKIEWCDATWQPVVGCTKVSDGCKFCWAEKMACRQANMEIARRELETDDTPSMSDCKVAGKYDNVVDLSVRKWNGTTFCDEKALEIPLKRKKPTMYFVCSMGDLFHESVPFEFIDKVMQTISCYPQQHFFQVLTKRPERMAEYFKCLYAGLTKFHDGKEFQWPFKNLWLGVTAENQEMANKRVPILLQIPAAVRFVSIEPCLDEAMIIPLKGVCFKKGVIIEEPEISWVIVGAESGPKARYCPIKNIRSIVNQCKDAGVPVFVKQVHMWKVNWSNNLCENESDARQHDMNPKRVLIKDINLFPEDLRIREYPKEVNK